MSGEKQRYLFNYELTPRKGVRNPEKFRTVISIKKKRRKMVKSITYFYKNNK